MLTFINEKGKTDWSKKIACACVMPGNQSEVRGIHMQILLKKLFTSSEEKKSGIISI